MANLPLPLLSSLRAFEATARHQSIKKASDELHVGHGGISRHIKRLERLLDQTLFERHHNRLLLNAAGEMLRDAVASGFAHIQRALTQLRDNQSTNRLVISVDPDFAGLWLVPRLAEFYAIVPNTLVEILAVRAADSLEDGRLDCVIQYAKAGSRFKNGTMLFQSRLFPVCARSVIQSPRLGSPDDLRHHILLHDRSTDEWEEYLRRCATKSYINVRLGMVFNQNALCLDAAARGQGVALGDDFLAANHLSEGRLVKPFGAAVLSTNAYYLVVSESGAQRPAVRSFRKWLLGSIERLRRDGRKT